MGTIRRLDPQTINKIAAGEVVERPASVVKELVDNALDARATCITIDLEEGGRDLIAVADDGTGMAPEDLPLAVQNHATSKLERIEDLLHLGTLGFRGEALASIAAVSRFRLTSRRPEDEIAHQIEVVDGKVSPVRPVAAPAGTQVRAAALFHNTRARREFLRTPASERRAVVEVVTRYALAHPQLRLLLREGQRDLLDLRPAATLRERAAELLGRPIERNLADVQAEKDALRVEGLASRPPYGQRTRQQQWIFVNGRPVRDRSLSYAITHAYRHAMPADRHPVVVLFLSLPNDHVDVNVHPTKSEVRFRDERLLQQTVIEALRAAVGPVAATDVERLPSPPRAVSLLKDWTPTPRGAWDAGRALYTPAEPHGAAAEVREAAPEATGGGRTPQPEPARPDRASDAAGAAGSLSPPGAAVPSTAPAGSPALPVGEAALYWQLHDAYILVQIQGGLVLVDQHAAHERVLYDRALAALENRKASTQGLLFPLLLELSVRQYAAFEESRDILDALGFQLRPFGGQSVHVEGIPAEMRNWDEGAVLLGILDDLAEGRQTAGLPLREKVLATYACRAAIMQGQRLGIPEMRALMDSLFATTHPYTCPHGRPSLLRIGLDDLDLKFGRTPKR